MSPNRKRVTVRIGIAQNGLAGSHGGKTVGIQHQLAFFRSLPHLLHSNHGAARSNAETDQSKHSPRGLSALLAVLQLLDLIMLVVVGRAAPMTAANDCGAASWLVPGRCHGCPAR